MMGAWEGACGKLDQYGMQYSRLFANLCNAGIPVDTLAKTALGVCHAEGLQKPASLAGLSVA